MSDAEWIRYLEESIRELRKEKENLKKEKWEIRQRLLNVEEENRKLKKRVKELEKENEKLKEKLLFYKWRWKQNKFGGWYFEVKSQKIYKIKKICITLQKNIRIFVLEINQTFNSYYLEMVNIIIEALEEENKWYKKENKKLEEENRLLKNEIAWLKDHTKYNSLTEEEYIDWTMTATEAKLRLEQARQNQIYVSNLEEENRKLKEDLERYKKQYEHSMGED